MNMPMSTTAGKMMMNMTGMMHMTTASGPVAKRHKMWMWYHTEVEDTVLFKGWTVFDAGSEFLFFSFTGIS